MKVIFYFIYFIFILYSCSPINKQHGYLLEDLVASTDKVSQFVEGTATQDDVLINLGSPSITIKDINNIWIYLISTKEENVFEKDKIVFQSIMRFEFDNDGILVSKSFSDKDNFTQISFSKDKTRVITDNYGITEQIYESFTRTQGQ